MTRVLRVDGARKVSAVRFRAVRRLGSGRPGAAIASLAAFVGASFVYLLAMAAGPIADLDRDQRFPQIVGDWRLRDDASLWFSRAALATFFVVALTVALVALAVGGPRRAAVAACAVAAGPIAAAVAASALGAADPLGGEASRASPGAFPSGHAAVGMSLALGLVIALPARRRALAALATVPAVSALAAVLVALGWHYPSDVIGALLLSASGAALVLAIAGALGRPADLRPGVALSTAGAVLVTVVGAAAALATLPDETARGFVGAHPAFIAYCATATVVVVGAHTAVVLLARELDGRPRRAPTA